MTQYSSVIFVQNRSKEVKQILHKVLPVLEEMLQYLLRPQKYIIRWWLRTSEPCFQIIKAGLERACLTKHVRLRTLPDSIKTFGLPRIDATASGIQNTSISLVRSCYFNVHICFVLLHYHYKLQLHICLLSEIQKKEKLWECEDNNKIVFHWKWRNCFPCFASINATIKCNSLNIKSATSKYLVKVC